MSTCGRTYMERAVEDLGRFTPLRRYGEALTALRGAGLALQRHLAQLHHTPGGNKQMSLYAHFGRVG